MSKRIYVVSRVLESGAKVYRLVNAVTKNSAVSHVAKGEYEAAVASQADLVRLLPETKVEEVGEVEAESVEA